MRIEIGADIPQDVLDKNKIQQQQAVWVIDFMRYARSQGADGGHFIRLDKLRLALTQPGFGFAPFVDLLLQFRSTAADLLLEDMGPDQHRHRGEKNNCQRDGGVDKKLFKISLGQEKAFFQPFMLNLIELPGAVQVLQAVGKNIKNVRVSLSDGVGVFNADIGFLQKATLSRACSSISFFPIYVSMIVYMRRP